MKTRKKLTCIGNVLTVITVLILVGSIAYAGDDPSIKGDLRKGIQLSMQNFVNAHTINGTFYIYDPIDNKLLNLKLKELHPGIVKKGNFYASCADFTEPGGKIVDLDFLVIPADHSLRTVQAVVHAVDGKKRPYQLESK
jgi:hypothetical protein